jgi:hypothetical protein
MAKITTNCDGINLLNRSNNMIVGQLNMQQDNSTKKPKMMIHDIRALLSCLMMQCKFSMAIRNADKEDLLNFIEQILDIINSAANVDLFIHDMHKTMPSFKSYCDQALRNSFPLRW